MTDDNVLNKSEARSEASSEDKKHGVAQGMVNPSKIYVKEVYGFFNRLRSIALWVLFAFYFVGCWLTWGDRQAVLFDLPARKFYVFGVTFWPQDFVLLSLFLIIMAFTLFTVTTLAGRIWCGYACPQTAWTFVYMWLEERIEGPRHARIKLDLAPMSLVKLIKKFTKHFLWLVLALATSFTFVGYFYSVRDLVSDIGSVDVSLWALFWLAFFTVTTYGAAGLLREQVCFFMCPYARFQAVMFDQDTLIVSYDETRGERERGRGKRKKNEDHKAKGMGDCIDCQQCVQVCPTGIDIRDGLQYQCIACALCVDACNEIMDKMGYDRNLISYTTENNLQGRKTKILRPRFAGYSFVLIVMVSALVYFLAARDSIELNIIRDRSALFKEASDGRIQNSYTLRIMNKSQDEGKYEVSVSGIDGMEMLGEHSIVLVAGEVRTLPVMIVVSRKDLVQHNMDIAFSVKAVGADANVQEESRFIGPLL